MKILNEFKKFAIKGNMVDMSVGIIIGGAFGQTVNSFVKDIIMPPLGYLTGNVDFSEKFILLKAATEKTDAITLNYGLFSNHIINFLIVSASIFIVIRYINKMKEEFVEKPDVQSPPPPKPPQDILLLTEIRDLLKEDEEKV